MTTPNRNCPVILLAILLGALAGCQPVPPSSHLDDLPSIRIPANDPVRTYEQYEEARGQAARRVPARLPRQHTERRPVTIIRMLADLPSAVSRNYARTLAAALRPYDVDGLDSVAQRGGGTATISYAELAEVEALSEHLLSGWEQDPPPPGFQKLPFEAGLDLYVAMALTCPSDYPPFNAISYSDFDPAEFAAGEDSLTTAPNAPANRAKYSTIAGACYRRFTDQTRPLNFTWIRMFEQDAEGYLRMFTMMEPTGHQTRDFFSAVRQRIPQVLALPLPAQTRKSFAESQSAGKSPDLESPWNMLDQNTWLAKDGEPTLKAFFSAAARGDQQTTRSLLASPPPLSDPALATFLRDCQAHHASFAFASASITRAGAVTCCLRLSSASGDTPTKLMSVTLQGAHGHYKLASLPKWDEN